MKITNEGIAVIESDTHICRWIQESGRLDHDQNLLPRIAKYISNGDTVVDVGAYVGDHTICYSCLVGGHGKVLAFEPNAEAFECLQHNLSQSKNTQCLRMALGSSVGSASIDDSCSNKGMAHLTQGNDVDVSTLDHLNLDRLNFMKIDCEGFELNVLQGGEQTIRKLMPVILIEINDATLGRYAISRNDIFMLLHSYGYRYRNVYRGRSLHGSQLDVICTPA
jgi:FkbM family methyltransferase